MKEPSACKRKIVRRVRRIVVEGSSERDKIFTRFKVVRGGLSSTQGSFISSVLSLLLATFYSHI